MYLKSLEASEMDHHMVEKCIVASKNQYYNFFFYRRNRKQNLNNIQIHAVMALYRSIWQR